MINGRPAISYTGEWYDLNHPTASGGSIVGSFHRDATASVHFNGTGIAWIGYRNGDVAGQMLLMDLEAMSVSGFLSFVSNAFDLSFSPRIL